MPPAIPPLQTKPAFLGTSRGSSQGDPAIGISRVNTARTTDTIRSPIIEDDAMEDYVVPYGDNLEDWNQNLGLMWNQIMDQGRYSTSASYTSIEVLMLSHDDAEDNDDLHVRKEIDKLEQVFAKTYNFGVTKKMIKKHKKAYKRSQAQVNAIVANWAYKHDGPSTLLIVYFAGHGVPSCDGELELMGRQEHGYQLGQEFNKVVWDNTERNLHYLISDVLQIFDCCFAGTMSPGQKDEDQTIEFLAACGADETTPPPGENSFTSALIWSLEELARQGGRFTVNHLIKNIEKAPNFPTNKQKPTLIRRAMKPRHQRIVIHQLKEEDSEKPSASNSTEERHQRKRPSEEQYVLDLKFAFHSWPTDEDISHLGQDLNKVVITRKLPMSYISWGGITTKQALARQAVQILRGLTSPPLKRERERDPSEDSVKKNLKRAVTGIESIGEQLNQYHDEYIHTKQLEMAHHGKEPEDRLIDVHSASVRSLSSDGLGTASTSEV